MQDLKETKEINEAKSPSASHESHESHESQESDESHESHEIHESHSSSLTAVDFIENQMKLEQDAKEIMPFDPDSCSFFETVQRQHVFACLTCRRKNNQLNGICYSCSIQCHSDHEIVELFSKRHFCCDCGTSRMPSFGGCNLRKNFSCLEPGSSTNVYGHNFEGRFCNCDSTYDPDNEMGTMFQCLLGDVCGEDWYHEECILGIPTGNAYKKKPVKSVSNSTSNTVYPPGVNVYESIESAAAQDVQAPEEIKTQQNNDSEDEEDNDNKTLQGLPDQNEFSAFICWKCVGRHHDVLGKWSGLKGIALPGVVHGDFKDLDDRNKKLGPTMDEVKKEEEAHQEEAYTDDSSNDISSKRKLTSDEIASKKAKLEPSESQSQRPFSLFLVEGYRQILSQTSDPELIKFLEKFPFLTKEEDLYEPPEDEDTTSSLLDAGTKALNSLPRQQAIEGMHAYSIMRTRLSAFLKPFAEQGKVVTEGDVNSFFETVNRERQEMLHNE